MRILVINLTRFGDLLQSQAALADLAAAGHSVGLVCLDNFRSTAALLRHVHSLYPLPGASLLANLERDWPCALSRLDAWSRAVVSDFSPERILNVTPSTAARLLGRSLAEHAGTQTGHDDQAVLPFDGFALDEAGFGRNETPWAAFFQGASRVRGVSPFNVADLFRRVAQNGTGRSGANPDGADDAPDLARPGPEAMERADALLVLRDTGRDTGPDNGRDSGAGGGTGSGTSAAPKGFIALQAGASEERRRWPADCFAALGGRLWREEGLCPVLLGSAGEKGLTAQVAAALRTAGAPHIDLAGATSLEELGAVLTRCRLLVSNDTGTLHLAAGLKVPVLGIFLATAQPWDTGPYRAGSCSLEPDLPCHPCAFGKTCPHTLPSGEERCRRSITPDSVAALALEFVRHGNWRHDGRKAEPAEGIRVWESVADGEGFLDLVSLSGHDREDRTVWLREQRWLYRQFLDRDQTLPFTPAPPPGELLSLPPEAKAALRGELTTALSLLDALIQQGTLLSQRPLTQIKERFLATASRLEALLRESPRLAALRLLWLDDAAGSAALPAVLSLAGQYTELLACLLRRIAADGSKAAT